MDNTELNPLVASELAKSAVSNNPEQNDALAWAMSPTYVQQKNQSEVIKRLDVNLSEFEYRLKGYAIDYSTGEIAKKGVPLLSERGAEHLMSFAHSHCNNILTMSSFDTATVKRMFFDADLSVIEFIFFNTTIYDIRIENANFIRQQFRALIRSCLHRAMNPNSLSDKSFIMTTNQRVEMMNQSSGGMPMGGGYGRGYGGGGSGRFSNFLNWMRGSGSGGTE